MFYAYEHVAYFYQINNFPKIWKFPVHFFLCIDNMSVVTFTGNRQLYYKATKQFGDAMLSLETHMNGCFDLHECIYIVCQGKSLHNIGYRVKN